ncbi:MAG: prepilin peptidase, partial [Actinomycetota bacterium]|nr:prepilin peptidase [Actinomycetota bacterium]
VGAAAVTGGWHRLAVAAGCAAASLMVFLALHLVSPRALGFGDVRLAPLIGGALGWLGVRYVVVGFVVANLLGAVTGIALLVSGRGSRRTPLPYGVFLALGAVLALFLGEMVGTRR